MRQYNHKLIFGKILQNIVCNDMHIDGCHGVVIVIAGD